MTRNKPRLQWHLFFGCIHLVVAGFFGYAFYIRYWKYRDCIREAMSSCITPDGDNLIEGGAMWSVFAFVFLFFAFRRGYKLITE